MPNASYNIQLSPEFRDLLEKSADYSHVISSAVRRGLDIANEIALGKIKRERFTGQGPFPVLRHKLGHRSRRLIRALKAAPARVRDFDNVRVESSIGSVVRYFGAHEFGLSERVKVKAHRRNMPEHTRRTPGGDEIRIAAHTQEVGAHTRAVNMPERRPLRAGLADDQLAAAIGLL